MRGQGHFRFDRARFSIGKSQSLRKIFEVQDQGNGGHGGLCVFQGLLWGQCSLVQRRLATGVHGPRNNNLGNWYAVSWPCGQMHLTRALVFRDQQISWSGCNMLWFHEIIVVTSSTKFDFSAFTDMAPYNFPLLFYLLNFISDVPNLLVICFRPQICS